MREYGSTYLGKRVALMMGQRWLFSLPGAYLVDTYVVGT